MTNKLDSYLKNKDLEILKLQDKINVIYKQKETAVRIRHNLKYLKKELNSPISNIGDFMAKEDPVNKKLYEVQTNLGFPKFVRHYLITPFHDSIRYRGMKEKLYNYLYNISVEELMEEIRINTLYDCTRTEKEKREFNKSYLAKLK